MSSTPGDLRWITLALDGDIATATIADDGAANTATIHELGGELCSLVEQFGHTKLILDCSNVAHMPSAALNRLMVLQKKVSAANGRLVLCGLTPAVSEVFELTKLHKMFNIQVDLQAAKECI
jgi:anti-sigma B factor antagonist